MTIAVPPRRNLLAKTIAAANPDLSQSEVARLAGTDRGNVARARKQERFGKDKLKSRAKT